MKYIKICSTAMVLLQWTRWTYYDSVNVVNKGTALKVQQQKIQLIFTNTVDNKHDN